MAMVMAPLGSTFGTVATGLPAAVGAAVGWGGAAPDGLAASVGLAAAAGGVVAAGAAGFGSPRRFAGPGGWAASAGFAASAGLAGAVVAAGAAACGAQATSASRPLISIAVQVALMPRDRRRSRLERNDVRWSPDPSIGPPPRCGGPPASTPVVVLPDSQVARRWASTCCWLLPLPGGLVAIRRLCGSPPSWFGAVGLSRSDAEHETTFDRIDRMAFSSWQSCPRSSVSRPGAGP